MMVVDTYKRGRTMFYEPRNVIERGKAGKYVSSPDKLAIVCDVYPKATRHWSASIKTRADFIIPDMEKSIFQVVEMKRSVGGVGDRRISPYLRMPLIARYHYIQPLETDVEYGGIFAYGDIETLPEITKVTRPIEISCPNQALVETLLGSKGKYTLEKVLSLIKNSAAELDWPLTGVEVRYIRDPEVKDWEYVLVLLAFTCDFDTADRHLHKLYDHIDMLSRKLGDEEAEILQRMIFFDIETKASISSD